MHNKVLQMQKALDTELDRMFLQQSKNAEIIQDHLEHIGDIMTRFPPDDANQNLITVALASIAILEVRYAQLEALIQSFERDGNIAIKKVLRLQ